MKLFVELFPPLTFFAIFILIGWFGIRKREIPLRLALDAVLSYYLVILIAFFLHVLMIFEEAFSTNSATFESISARAILIPTGERLLMHIIYTSIIATVLWLFFAWIAHKTQNKYLDHADALVLSFGILISGWPNLFLFLFLVFLFTAIWSLGAMLFKRTSQLRIPITPFFIFAGVVILLWGDYLSQLTGLYAIR